MVKVFQDGKMQWEIRQADGTKVYSDMPWPTVRANPDPRKKTGTVKNLFVIDMRKMTER